MAHRVSVQEHPQVRLGLLGGFTLTADGRPVTLPWHGRRLLVLLVMRRLTRSQAARLLWPDTDPSHAQARLRTTLWRINHGCPSVVETDSDSVALAKFVKVDVYELAEWATAGHDRVGSPFAMSGDWQLLPGWDDDWIEIERERLRQLRLHGLEDMAWSLLAQGETGPALQAALAVVREDPLRESGYRIVIASHVVEGNMADARRTYRAVCSLLRREMGVEPSVALRRLSREHGLDADAPAPRAARNHSPDQRPVQRVAVPFSLADEATQILSVE